MLIFTSLMAVLPNIAENDFERAVLSMTGASEMEELDQNTISHYQYLTEHPININNASRSRLLASELFSRYQVESILDYRSRNGDILSLSELSLIDGFNKKSVELYSIFISLKSERDAGKRNYDNFPQSISIQGTMKRSGKDNPTYANWLKYDGEFTERFEINIAQKLDFPKPELKIGTVGAAYYGKSSLGKIVVGNYNVRIGQGLAIWSGTTRSGFSTASAFIKNGSGVSLTQSFSSTLRGLACDFSIKGIDVCLGYGDCGMAFLCADKTGKTWQAGVSALIYGDLLNIQKAGQTGHTCCISGNFKAGFPGGAAFGEVAWEIGGAAAAVAGVFWVPDYGTRLSCVFRYYPSNYKGTWAGAVRSASKVSDEHGIAFGATSKWGNATFDAVWHPSKKVIQYKLLGNLAPEIKLGKRTFIPSARASVKYTPAYDLKWRTDIRVQTDLKVERFSFSARGNTVHSREWGWMGYMEGGYESIFKIFLRAGVFKVDNWDDRIYVYERDAPGNYNSPALYGRGWWCSLLAGLKIKKEKRTSHSLYLRSSFTSYDFMPTPKPSKLELKLQYGIRF